MSDFNGLACGLNKAVPGAFPARSVAAPVRNLQLRSCGVLSKPAPALPGIPTDLDAGLDHGEGNDQRTERCKAQYDSSDVQECSIMAVDQQNDRNGHCRNPDD